MRVCKKCKSVTFTSVALPRDNTMDIVAGILIVRMILGHYMSMCGLQETFLFKSTHVLFFFMPWFFYKSGMFCSIEQKDPKAFLIKDVRKFIIPCIFFSIMGLIISVSLAATEITEKSVIHTIISDCGSVVLHGSTSSNAPLWFLVTLFLVRGVFNYVRDFVNHYVLMVVCLVMALMHYLFIAPYGICWFGNFCSGLFFYIAGMKLKQLQYNKWIIRISLLILIAIGLTKPTIVSMFPNLLIYDNGIYLLWYPFCLAGIIVFNNLVKSFGGFLTHYHFESIGHYSMVYYMAHYPLGLLIHALYRYYCVQQNNWELLIYLLIICCGLLPFLTYVFNTKRMSKFIGI